MDIPKSHPRYRSLATRELLVELSKRGIVSTAGLIAHGRGEAFDYVLGERTIPPAELAEKVAAAYLVLAENPVLSVNGNAAALVGRELVELARAIPAKIEVNLFHRTPERMAAVAGHMRDCGAADVLGLEPDEFIPGLDHARAHCTGEGIFSADTVLVPLEDGDRAQALRGMGKNVITIDINPLSRTSRTATVSIVDEVTRAVPNVTRYTNALKENLDRAGNIIAEFDNSHNLANCIEHIAASLIDRQTD